MGNGFVLFFRSPSSRRCLLLHSYFRTLFLLHAVLSFEPPFVDSELNPTMSARPM